MTLGKFIKANRLRFAVMLGVTLAHAAAAVFVAKSVRWLFDSTIANAPGASGLRFHPLVPALMAIVALFATTMGLRRLTDGIGLAYVHDLRLRLFRHLLKASPGQGGKGKRANLLLPFVGDLTAIRQWVGDGLARLAMGSIVTVLLLGFIALDHGILALTLGAAITALCLLALLLRKPFDQATRDVRRHRGLLSTFVAGRLEAAATIASMGRSRTELKKLARRSEELTAAGLRRAWLVGALRALAQSSATVMLVLLLVVVQGEVRNATFSPGEVLGLMSLVGVLGHALHDMGRAMELYVPGRVALQRINRLMALPPRIKRGKSKRQKDTTGLEIDRVAVPGMAKSVTLKATLGEVILVDGPTGSGKSALMAILGGLEAPVHGRVRIEGIDLAALTMAEQQKLVGLASQAVPLLPGSVGMNLRYRQPGASAASVLDLVSSLGLENGALAVERVLGDPRALLSSGEYEALLVARALLNRPAILLLDSIDGHLPDETVARLAGIISSYPGVVIMVTQRHALRQCATRIWRIADGRIHEAMESGLQPVATLPSRRRPAA